MEIEFEIWNKRWNRWATEEEVSKYVSLQYFGRGFIEKAVVTTTNADIEIRHVTTTESYCGGL